MEVIYPTSDTQTNVHHDDIESQDIDDMVQLRDIQEESILSNLHTRYVKGNIYTYTGRILVAINPYQQLGIYGPDQVKPPEYQRIGQQDPHLFDIGAEAYSCMRETKNNQCIIFTGESGAGKTESAKLMMQYLVTIDKAPSNTIREQILAALSVFESFSNAKTVKNDNASRFGKYTEVFYSGRGMITGAKIAENQLETSRVVKQAPGERNYHVFYEMLMSQDKTAELSLDTAEKYHYLNQGKRAITIEGKSDSDDFQRLVGALQTLQFTPLERDTMFEVLAAILHLGNVTFQTGQSDSDETLVIQNQLSLKLAANLLGLRPKDVENAITSLLKETTREKASIPRSQDHATQARDGIAKTLYSGLFAWLLNSINTMLAYTQKKDDPSIAILDMFGFEVFDVNSLEQLCINYANEYLQHFYNKHIFQLEQQEYAQEKIEWTEISYTDNRPSFDLIGKRPIGILHLLDDESFSVVPKGTDKTFLEKCYSYHYGNSCFEKPKMTFMKFGIRHYAGKVYYSAENFLAKNRDTLKTNVIALLINSESKTISDMFQMVQQQEEEVTMARRSRVASPLRKIWASTIAARCKESLRDLLEKMSTCTPFFVRCLKPNENKAPLQFDSSLVLKQIRYSNMLETLQIRKAGYPVRMTFQKLCTRYRYMVDWSQITRDETPDRVCLYILQEGALRFVEELPEGAEQDVELDSTTLYKVTSTKVFLKEVLASFFEYHRRKTLHHAVLVIQHWARGHLARRNYLYMREACIRIQSRLRKFLARKKYLKLRKGIQKDH